jgi:hypothetical protein
MINKNTAMERVLFANQTEQKLQFKTLGLDRMTSSASHVGVADGKQ